MDSKAQFAESNKEVEEVVEFLEDWRAKKTWHGHKGGKFRILKFN